VGELPEIRTLKNNQEKKQPWSYRNNPTNGKKINFLNFYNEKGRLTKKMCMKMEL